MKKEALSNKRGTLYDATGVELAVNLDVIHCMRAPPDSE